MKIKMSSLWSAEAQIDFLRFDWHFLSTDFGVLVRDMKMFWPVAKVAIRIGCGTNLKMTLIPMFQIENATKLGMLVFFFNFLFGPNSPPESYANQASKPAI